MEELWELRRYVEKGEVDAALALLDEMEEMSRDDKITRMRSYMKILLTHLIKRAVEKRCTRSWDVSIRNALDEITTHNKRRKAGGWYLTRDELIETLHEAYELALERAALEAFGGAYTAVDVRTMHDPSALLHEAMQLIEQTQAGTLRHA
jgi:hypothetical protein